MAVLTDLLNGQHFSGAGAEVASDRRCQNIAAPLIQDFKLYLHWSGRCPTISRACLPRGYVFYNDLLLTWKYYEAHSRVGWGE